MKFPSHYRAPEVISCKHDLALTASLSGDLENASDRYSELLETLAVTEKDWAVLALSRVMRDAAMNKVRLGIAERDRALISDGAKMVKQAHVPVDGLITAKNVSTEALAYLHDENGATHGVRARIATVQMVQDIFWEEPFSYEEEYAVTATGAYATADDHLLRGGNYYYRTSNAANFARHHAAHGESYMQVIRWLSIAGKRTVSAAFSDRRQFKKCLETTGHRALAAPTAVARRSVLQRP